MILSIVVLSYNRPCQVERILGKFVGFRSEEVELVIKDDVSPEFQEIEKVVSKYREKIGIDVILHKNENNMGYDRNLLDVFDIVNGDYVFLLSDDDYVEPDYLPDLLSKLKRKECSVYITPYGANGIWNRVLDYQVSVEKFSTVIYDSILFSGLVFRVDAVQALEKNIRFLDGCIYTQVYISSLLVFREMRVGRGPIKLLFLGGDGENFFGKNEAAKNASLLTDRSRVTANLDYQKFLIKVVMNVASKTSPNIFFSFSREYEKRLIGYALLARGKGIKNYKKFLTHHKEFGAFSGPSVDLLFKLFLIFPAPFAWWINRLGIKILRKSG